MWAVVSTIDGPLAASIRECWELLETELGVSAAANLLPAPHVTWVGFDHVDLHRASSLIANVADDTGAIEVVGGGLGVFGTERPIVHVPIVKSPAMTALHQRLCSGLKLDGRDVAARYLPDRWMPHATLALNDIDLDRAAHSFELIETSGIDLSAPGTLTSISLTRDVHTRHEIAATWQLPAQPPLR